MRHRSSLDRSTMFSNLLTLSSNFGKMERSAGEKVVTDALRAWYDSTDSDMYAFTREWVRGHRKDLLPVK